MSALAVLLAVAMLTGSPAPALNPATGNVIAVAEKKKKKPKWRLPRACKDAQAKTLFRAGFKKPGMIRGAWAITYRESRHQSLDESSRWFSGALGTWQIQTSAWSRQPWWSRSAMLSKHAQSKIVRKHFLRDNMRHWGYSYSFAGDTWYEDAGMYFGLWGSATTFAWVIQPFNSAYSAFPNNCLPEKR